MKCPPGGDGFNPCMQDKGWHGVPPGINPSPPGANAMTEPPLYSLNVQEWKSTLL